MILYIKNMVCNRCPCVNKVLVVGRLGHMMPLTSYKIMHKTANLSPADKTLLIDWMQTKSDSLAQIK